MAAAVDVEYCDAFIEEAPEDVATRMAEQQPSLVGFSCYVWNIEATLAVAQEFKRLRPDARVILGGPEAGGLARRILKSSPVVDFIATGEGEETFRLLLRALFLGEGELAAVPGLARREHGRLAIRPEPPLIDLAHEPSPYLSHDVPMPHDPGAVLVETSRGCPFACAYCNWGRRKMRYLSLERIEDDFKFVLEYSSCVILNDADILVERKRALAIMTAFLCASQGRSAVLTVETNPLHLRPEIVDLVARFPGNFSFAFGLQSISPQVNQLVGRPFNLEDIEARLSYFKARCPDVDTRFSLIYGLPGDSLRGFEQTLEWALRHNPGRLCLNQCLALPGSELTRRKQDFGLKIENRAPHRVLSTPTMSAGDMRKARRMASLILFLFAFQQPSLSDRFRGCRPPHKNGGILPLLAKWEAFLIKNGIEIERCGRFERALGFPYDPGELSAQEFLRNPLELAVLMKATDIFLRELDRRRSL
ncbi:MAG: cobalamin-dependent protein [Elusimicrobia bacterium]|nr:cobalamin-dependent protein [Elusimicrobiota bacterium]